MFLDRTLITLAWSLQIGIDLEQWIWKFYEAVTSGTLSVRSNHPGVLIGFISAGAVAGF